jgi:hypothetical protein
VSLLLGVAVIISEGTAMDVAVILTQFSVITQSLNFTAYDMNMHFCRTVVSDICTVINPNPYSYRVSKTYYKIILTLLLNIGSILEL